MDRTYSAAGRWAFGGGLFNCIAALLLGLPFTDNLMFEIVNDLNAGLGLSGEEWTLAPNPANQLFVNTAGLALFLVGMTLIYASRDIANRIAIPLLNGCVRFVWAVVATYYVVAHGLQQVFVALIAIDLILAGAYIYFYLKINQPMSMGAMATR
tara:strand:- start:1819 stop:2280 length:462 start_codon:yes stop_codon:yes gene_type:complete